jgi:anti-sigma B factor antagonist
LEEKMADIFREEKGVTVLEFEGKIMGTPQDSSLTGKIYKQIDQGKLKFVFDLSKVDWMNSRGLGLLITVHTALLNRNGHLKLACLSEKVRSLLDKCKIFAIFDTYETVEEALNSF